MYAAAAGVLAVLAALGISELAAGLIAPVPSLVESVADAVIDGAPAPVKDWAIATFGTANKTVLVVGIVVVLAGLGALIGTVGRVRFGPAALALAVLAAIGTGAGLLAVTPGPSAAGAFVAGALALGAALLILRVLLGLLPDLPRRDQPAAVGPAGDGSGADGSAADGSAADVSGAGDAPSRRAFLAASGVVAILAAGSATAGRWLLTQGSRALAVRYSILLPAARPPLPAPPPAAAFAEPGLSALVTPNTDFFRIDTAITIPRVDSRTWTLRVHGMVDRPYELTFDELLSLEMVERWITLSCVSNPVGGSLVGNAAWRGVPLAALLDRAGVRAGADQIVGRSVDGFTVGFPTAAAFDGRDALVAVAMNGEPLPFRHGFPARLVVAGLYGYVSATKWLSELELTGWDAFDAYWVPRGWAKEAPVKTQSRIDTPRSGARIPPGPRAIAGVAWAPGLGITRVEVQVDDGAWEDAELAEALDRNAWRQWRLPWSPGPGPHTIRVRATDGSGETQTGASAPPAPDGATGWHTVRVTVQA